ncbi:MAG: bacillithiol biosynthesis cysteine-adding enzyme BshC [Calditrichaeota bacterium]|nr:MAG: bacillithiol biosynthesis cysteine-adding enzyme BshC [Calditrichota bacterium]
MQKIPFSQIPKISQFFLDYLEENPKVSKYYPNGFKTKEDFAKVISSKAKEEILREELVEGLLAENNSLGATKKTLANIKLLGDENTFAVVTGQQMGIFLGPLYTTYKALTTVKLCEKLKSWFPDKNFVPVFWMESEDHDFAEAAKNYFLTQQGQLFETSYKNAPNKKIPVGSLEFSQEISEITDEIFTQTGSTEFSEELKKVLSESYTGGKTFAEAFGTLFHKLLGDFGVVTINPHDTFWKKNSVAFFETAISKNEKISQALEKIKGEIEAEGFSPQIATQPENSNLFLLLEKERHKLTREGENYSLSGREENFTKEELLSLTDVTPNLFVTNVVLRPLYQDFLLPTVAYVGGPSEVAYFAQILKLYPIFEIAEPVIFPRSSVILLEKRIQRLLGKLGIELKDSFQNEDEFVKAILENLGETPEKMISDFSEKITAQFAELKNKLSEIDPVLNDISSKTLEKALHQFNVLGQKAGNSYKRKN